jgi:hypothetical protein
LAQQSSISGGFTAMFQDLLPPQKKNGLNTKTITNVKKPLFLGISEIKLFHPPPKTIIAHKLPIPFPPILKMNPNKTKTHNHRQRHLANIKQKGPI